MEEMGADNIFIFGMTVEDVAALYKRGLVLFACFTGMFWGWYCLPVLLGCFGVGTVCLFYWDVLGWYCLPVLLGCFGVSTLCLFYWDVLGLVLFACLPYKLFRMLRYYLKLN